jgi:hypothetical protein
VKPDWLQTLTLGIAVIGAVLGILNTWRAYSSDRVRIRVRPSWALLTGGGEVLAVEVVNLSTFAVTVTALGFTKLHSSSHAQVISPTLSTGDCLPKRLDPRTGFTALVDPREFMKITAVDEAYVRTACGETVTGGRVAIANALHNFSLGG